MHRRSSGRVAAIVVLLALAGGTQPAQADDPDDPVDPTAPVVVDDTVRVWPGDTRTLDVLANDSDPGGDDLAVCLLPVQALRDPSPVDVEDLASSPFGGDPGDLRVSVAAHAAPGSYAIHYYTCSRTRLTPATLTVEVRRLDPLRVTASSRRGFLTITNPNPARVRVDAFGRHYCLTTSRSVPARSTREMRVHESVIHWQATITRNTWAGSGTVHDIPLRRSDASWPGGGCHPVAKGAVRADAPGTEPEVDPTAPVVTGDEITLWPGGYGLVDVLANDVDPTGDTLAPCRLPSYVTASGRARPVAVRTDPFGELPTGTLIVDTANRARGVYAVHYYVCSHTRLTEATLTVTVRDVAPVDVAAVEGRPGFIQATNHNDRRILLYATDRSGCRVAADARIRAGATKTFHVRDHLIRWQAVIADETSLGIADSGTLRDVPLDGNPASPIRGKSCVVAWSIGRQAAAGQVAPRITTS